MGSKLGNISKIAIFVVMERAIPEGDQATGEALAVYGKVLNKRLVIQFLLFTHPEAGATGEALVYNNIKIRMSVCLFV